MMGWSWIMLLFTIIIAYCIAKQMCRCFFAGSRRISHLAIFPPRLGDPPTGRGIAYCAFCLACFPASACLINPASCFLPHHASACLPGAAVWSADVASEFCFVNKSTWLLLSSAPAYLQSVASDKVLGDFLPSQSLSILVSEDPCALRQKQP